MRRIFDTIPRKFLEGSRCLQFSPDPALEPSWFAELAVSVWGGENSLDMMAIALPDGRYDWVYSSHVINHVPDEVAALKEQLRVVGNGTIVLSVGGTVFNYDVKPSDKMFGPDRQFKLYGTMYADDLQAVLPEVAVLELVAIDPATVSLDAVYFASRDEERLREMAIAAAAQNIHARVFPPKERARAAEVPASPRTISDPWEGLRAEIRLWKEVGGRARFWLRDDDSTSADPRLVELVNLCHREHIPLALAVIPLPMQLDLVELIGRQEIVTPLQHGFDHQNRSSETPKSEFPANRSPVEAIRSIQLGWHVLSDTFGDRALPVFVPPWGTCAPVFQNKLKDLGFIGYSGSRVAGELHRRGVTPGGLRLASAHVAVNRTARTGGEPVPEKKVIEFLTSVVRAIRNDSSDRDEPVGIMTHHWGVDDTVRAFLKRLFDETRGAGATWVSAHDLFVTPS